MFLVPWLSMPGPAWVIKSLVFVQGWGPRERRGGAVSTQVSVMLLLIRFLPMTFMVVNLCGVE